MVTGSPREPRVREKVASFVRSMEDHRTEEAQESLYDLLEMVDHEAAVTHLRETTVSNADIAALIQEMRSGFAAMDKRFESMDRRFDDLIHQMDKRFESVDKRFESMDKRFESMDKRFDDLIHQMDKRFESMDRRFDDLIHQMDMRFAATDKRLGILTWMMGAWMTLLTLIIGIIVLIR